MEKKNYVPMDGNEAAAYAAYAFTEIAAIYPITPSSPMAEKTDEWSAREKRICSDSLSDLSRCSPRRELSELCTVRWRPGASPRRSPLLRDCC